MYPASAKLQALRVAVCGMEHYLGLAPSYEVKRNNLLLEIERECFTYVAEFEIR